MTPEEIFIRDFLETLCEIFPDDFDKSDIEKALIGEDGKNSMKIAKNFMAKGWVKQ